MFDQPVSLDLTDTFQYTYLFDDPNGEHAGKVDGEFVPLVKHNIYNTLDVNLSMGDYRLGGRFDLNLWADRAYGDHCTGKASDPTFCQYEDWKYENRFIAERLFFMVAREEFDLTLGDFYASVGRGLALNVVKLGDLSQDNAIRGGKFDLHYGRVAMTLLGGEFNVLDTDQTTGYRGPWAKENVVAGRLEVSPLETLQVGGHVVAILTDCDSFCDGWGAKTPLLGHHLVGGAGFEWNDLWDGRISLAGEFDLQKTVQDGEVIRGVSDDEAESPGIAAYGTGSLTLMDFVFMTEFKYYNGFRLKAPRHRYEPYALYYHQPPTLEWIRATIDNNSSVSGFRSRLDYTFRFISAVDLTAALSYGYFENWDNIGYFEDLEQHPGDRRVHDVFGAVELLWLEGAGVFKATAGQRSESYLATDALFHRDIYLEFDLEQAFLENHAIKFAGLYRLRSKAEHLDEDGRLAPWNDLELVLEYKWSPHLSLAFSYERNENEDESPDQANFFRGSARFYITTGTYIEASAGENKPGIKCINGICRYIPKFSGVLVQFVGRL